MTQPTPPNPLNILSAKILKGSGENPDDVRITFIEHFPDKSTLKTPGEFTRQPHPDFKEALAALRVHLAVLADQIDIAQTNDEALINKFHVHGYHITGDKNKGFMIHGSKDGKYGRVGIDTKNILFQSKTMTDEYPLAELLLEALNNAGKEAAEYIRGKRLPDVQGDLFQSAQVAKPVIFPEQETDVSHLYGIEPESILQKAEAEAKERLDRENVKTEHKTEVVPGLGVVRSSSYERKGHIPQADPEAMERVKEDVTYGIDLAKDESETVKMEIPPVIKKGTKKVKQTPENKSGEISE